ncbi:MAG: hypothetical protein J7M12_05080 [Candidatus Hydrogenedentes bacterium]|nr:hypothetical protein [Candidatus Hydrogenedentota bacterium]
MSRQSVIDNWYTDMTCKKTLLVYSAGFHFEQAAETIKTLFPETELTAAVPPSMIDRARLCPAVDRVIPTARERYSPLRHPIAIIGYVRNLRREQYDLAVAMFRSKKLGFLLYCTRSRNQAVASAAGELDPWNVGLIRAAAAVPIAAARRLGGLAVYGVIRLIVGLWQAATFLRPPTKPTAR